jgi:hypothetical protein
MIVSKLLTKLKSFFFGHPIFPHYDHLNRHLGILIHSILEKLEFCRRLNYFRAKYEVSLLRRAYNIRMSGLKPSKENEADMRIRLTLLDKIISNLLDINKLYMRFSKAEKRHIEFNAFLDGICPSFDHLRILHRVDEYEALVAMGKKLDSIYFMRGTSMTTKLYQNLIEQIETLIEKHLYISRSPSWANPYGVKEMTLSSLSDQQRYVLYYKSLKRDLDTLLGLNDYLSININRNKYK